MLGVKLMFSNFKEYKEDPAFMNNLLKKFDPNTGKQPDLTNEERLVTVGIISKSRSTYGDGEDNYKFKLACAVCDKKQLAFDQITVIWSIIRQFQFEN